MLRQGPLADLLRVVFVAGTPHVSHVGFFGIEGIVVWVRLFYFELISAGVA